MAVSTLKSRIPTVINNLKSVDTQDRRLLRDFLELVLTEMETYESLIADNGLDGLVLADLSGATDGQQLTYNSSNDNWEPDTA